MTDTAADYEHFARGALTRYGLDGASLRLLSFSENATYRAERGDDSLVIRVHRPGYNTRTEVESELAWMEGVRTGSSIRTPEVHAMIDGGKVAEVVHAGESRLVDAFEFIPGEIAESPDSGIDYFDLGAITAELHRHARSWNRPEGFRRFRWDLDTMLGREGRWGDWRDAPNLTDRDRDAIEKAETKVRSRLARFGTGRDRFGLVHADLRLSNLIVDDGEIVVIDFDDCGWSWYLTDLAATITWNEAASDAEDVIEQWLLGYLTVGELEPDAVREIPTFVMLRRLMITAWIGTHPESEPAKNLGGHLASETAALARRYVDDPAWFAFDHAALLQCIRAAGASETGLPG